MKVNKSLLRKLPVLMVFPIVLFFSINSANAEDNLEPQQSIQQKIDADKSLGGRFSIYGELGGKINPNGVAFLGGIKYRNSYHYDAKYDAVSSYEETGIDIGVTPAFIQAGVHAEWMPWLFLQMRAQYDYMEYTGIYNGLLSFPSGNSPYGDDVRKDRHDEEKTHGSRIMLQPTLQGKVANFIIRNQTDLAYYTFAGRGPYFLELWYNTLMKDGDYLVANRTQFFYSFLSDIKEKKLLAGPYYEVTRAVDAQITQQKVGVAVYWESESSVWRISHSYMGIMGGYHLGDPSRQGQFYLVLGAGFEYNL